MFEFMNRERCAAAMLCSSLTMTTAAMAQGVGGSPAVGSLPRDLTAWGMFRDADVVVELVIIGLALASLLTWTIAIAKTREILAARRQLAADLETLEAAPSLTAVGALSNPVVLLADAASREVATAPHPDDTDGIKERIASRLGRIEAAFGRA